MSPTMQARALLVPVAASLGALLLALAPAASASVGMPQHFSFTDTNVVIDDTSCPFPITITIHSDFVGTVFFDAQGNFQSLIVHENAVGTNEANGLSLREADHFTDFIDAAGFDKEVGVPIHVQDGGLVIRDAGFLVFNPDGSVSLIHGPHPLLEGDTSAVCAALS